MLTSKLKYGVGLSDLTGTLNDQRLYVFAVFPLLKILGNLSVHIHGVSSRDKPRMEFCTDSSFHKWEYCVRLACKIRLNHFFCVMQGSGRRPVG